jgi:hypothetical protein
MSNKDSKKFKNMVVKLENTTTERDEYKSLYEEMVIINEKNTLIIDVLQEQLIENGMTVH